MPLTVFLATTLAAFHFSTFRAGVSSALSNLQTRAQITQRNNNSSVVLTTKSVRTGQLAPACPWQPCAGPHSFHYSNSSFRTYRKLGKLYEVASQRNMPLPVLVSGQARNLYVHGGLDVNDSDIDLGSPLGTSSWGQVALNQTHKVGSLLKSLNPKVSFVPDFELHGHVTYGTCECRLPDMSRIICVSDIESYLKDHYGSSWWIDMPDMKPSIVLGNESQPAWVQPALKSLKAYDENEDGQISAAEIGTQTCNTSANLREQAAADLTKLLRRLEGLKTF